MGNRPSSVQPTGPPPLLSAAVLGNLEKFGESWTGENSIETRDAQENNILHALFSCRGVGISNCPVILQKIHHGLPQSRWMEAYNARNAIGCTPLWILVAYGNVNLLKNVCQKFEDANQKKAFLEILQQHNHQGDSPFLATCSQGNTDMVRFFKEEILSADQFTATIRESNQKGTTPLQIVVGNNHLELLEYFMGEEKSVVQSQLLERNKQGLSLFHICSERNAHEMLETILTFLAETENNKGLKQIMSLKDKNGANALHVAAFCGNDEAARVWIDAILKENNSGDNKSAVELLDHLDGQGRTAYWLGMVQGRETIGTLLADKGVDTSNPKMLQEIEEAQERRTKAAEARKQPGQTIDGSALIGR